MSSCGFCNKVRNKLKNTTNNILQKTFVSTTLKKTGLPSYVHRSLTLTKSGKIKR